MSTSASGEWYGWAGVDKTSNREYFVQYLNQMSALDAVRAAKRQSYAMMNVQAGHDILDVGCGVGDDVVALARLGVARVVGVDNSETMIQEAQRRVDGLDLPVEFRVADVYALPFPGQSFDGCRADRLFQHLAEPQLALVELVRVTRPGGRMVIVDPDWDTLTINSPDRSLTRKMVHTWCDAIRNGWIGRQLPTLFTAAGLLDIAMAPITLILLDLDLADQIFYLCKTVGMMVQAGLVTAEAADAWWSQLEAANGAGQFFSSLTGFIVAGTVPGTRAERADA